MPPTPAGEAILLLAAVLGSPAMSSVLGDAEGEKVTDLVVSIPPGVLLLSPLSWRSNELIGISGSPS
jgi:hypothetical protein